VKLLFNQLAGDPHRLALAEEQNTGREFAFRLLRVRRQYRLFKHRIPEQGEETREHGRSREHENPLTALGDPSLPLKCNKHGYDARRNIVGIMVLDFLILTGISSLSALFYFVKQRPTSASKAKQSSSGRFVFHTVKVVLHNASWASIREHPEHKI